MSARSLSPRPQPTTGRATEILFSRLHPTDLAEIETRLNEEQRTAWTFASGLERKRLAMSFGLEYDVDGVAERTGLAPATPPEGIHLMGRGLPGQTGGAYAYADLVLESLDAVGHTLVAGEHVLDFSCSSGRVVRPLAAAYPKVHWHGCDPNAEAIAWARENVIGVDFFRSDTSPPLDLEQSYFAAVFAISVWSHYSAQGALRWLDEMHRLIRPGGHLIFTTHGFQSSVWFSDNRDPAIESVLGEGWITETARRLEHDGHCFWSVFGPRGDFGVIDDDWGLAFFTPEWLAEHVTPAWALSMYRLGRADGNQDLFVLQRR